MEKTLAELAKLIKAKIVGDATTKITGIATLSSAQQGDLSFFHSSKYQQQLVETKATAVILSADAVEKCPCIALVVDNPYFAYAQIANLFAYQDRQQEGIHPTVVIGKNCQIAKSAVIKPHVVIENNVIIGENVTIGPGCVIGEYCEIGEASCLHANVTLYHHVTLGKRVILSSGTVVGSDGFGNAFYQGTWHKVPQLGGVVLEDDVEVGANTTIDRGAIDNTHIGKGVKLDNQIQIGHNVIIGQHTVIAASVGIAGSAKIGSYCMIGGGAGINGHIEIADQVVITGMAMITNSIKEPGVYSSGTGFMPSRQWRKNVVRFRQLDKLAKQVKQIAARITERDD